MLETSARLLRLLSLLESGRDWTGAELADRMAVSTRTVRNDVERLRKLGYPVHATRGAVGGYRLGPGAALPPLLLDDEEAVAIAVGLRTATVGAITGIEETAVRAGQAGAGAAPRRLGEPARRRAAPLYAVLTSLAPTNGTSGDRDGTQPQSTGQPHHSLGRNHSSQFRGGGLGHAPATVIADRVPPAAGVVEPVDERTCLLDTGADTVETLGVYMGLLGADFEVRDPPELIAYLRELSARYGRATPG